MSLVVHTARVSSRDSDRLDVTRQGATNQRKLGQDAPGEPFAPSWPLLMRGKRGEIGWDEYQVGYWREMNASRRDNRAAWDALLVRPRVVLCCFCVDPDECHRSVLARFMAKLGAEVGGEIGLEEAVAACRAAALGGKLTARDIANAARDAGAELCVVWTRLHKLEVIGTPYREAVERGLHRALREATR